MSPPDRELLRKLADWPTDGDPVTTLYLEVDGRRHPRRADYVVRADDLLNKAVERASIDGAAADAVRRDAERIRRFVDEEFERKGVRGVVLFSCAAAGLWDDVRLAQPVRDRAVVRESPYLLPLEATLELAERICVAVVDRAKARLFITNLAEIEEVSEVLDDVPARHDQGGWSQARHQRHIEDHVQRHLRRVADLLLRLRQRRRYEHLILSGPDGVTSELERGLHEYVRRVVADRAAFPVSTPPATVLEHALEVERRIDADREAAAVRTLSEALASPSGRAVAGMAPTLEALEAGRVEMLVVLATPSADVDDRVEDAVEAALRRGSRVESVAGSGQLERLGGIGALLRF
ncbi:MAG TPA: Vms1/Ankzf1 family peptidyl-tRNA hydrolase [Actinomycetota bacterium]|nr:Vms1/Ankzf1 family peptidyl-tRNA hydrolase [Actinomycetota bacterium]